MKTFIIPVVWECYGKLSVQAESVEQAIEKAYSLPLPEGVYLDDSFRIDHEGIPFNNNLTPEETATLKEMEKARISGL